VKGYKTPFVVPATLSSLDFSRPEGFGLRASLLASTHVASVLPEDFIVLDTIGRADCLIHEMRLTGLSANGLGQLVGISSGRFSKVLRRQSPLSRTESAELDRICRLIRTADAAFKPGILNFSNPGAVKELLDIIDNAVILPPQIFQVVSKGD
jgi:hypothetical protein